MIPNWNNTRAAETRGFLNTSTGQILLAGLKSSADSIPKGATLEEEALNSREARGARGNINEILAAANFDEKIDTSEREDIDIELTTRPAESN